MNISTISSLHISIGSCLGKLFTKILQYRISSYLEENNLIEDNQAGFRQDYRTTDQIVKEFNQWQY
jgi:hypothetical protein